MTHPQRVLYPESDITKQQLGEYYLAVADGMLPYVAHRPLSIVRCPDGLAGQRFFQKHPGPATPEELDRIRIREKKEQAEYLVIRDAQSLVALVQISALEIHVWGSTVDQVESPDVMVLDLDPAPDVAWRDVAAAAVELRKFLEDLELTSFVKTSGGKGLHLCVPLRRRHSWREVRDFSELVARAVERAAPDCYVANMSKKKREGKIFIDYLRNQRGATWIAPFSTRARPGAPVSLPVSWQALSRIKSADQFQLGSVLSRLRAQKRDPWEDFLTTRQQITRSMLKKLS